MSRKLTYNEFVGIVAEEADLSQRFAQTFTKKVVDLIREGLERDGKVNLTKLGKFEIQEVAEKEGRNPNSGEPITIPAHKRVVFKPYKKVRERINAAYQELEPVFLDDKDESEEEIFQSDQYEKDKASDYSENEIHSVSERLGISEKWFLASVIMLVGGITLLSFLFKRD